MRRICTRRVIMQTYSCSHLRSYIRLLQTDSTWDMPVLVGARACATATLCSRRCLTTSLLRPASLPRLSCKNQRTMTVTQAAGTSPTPKQPPVLVSFDVDGTLIHSIGKEANRLHKEAFIHGFKQVFGLDTHIDVIKHHGGTDPLIILAVLEHHGIPKEQSMPRLKEVEAAMSDYFTSHMERAGTGLELLPGVQELLQALQADGGFLTCLVTGNLEPIGWGKMSALGISKMFSNPCFGGFGSDYCSGNTVEMWRDRCEFVRLAAVKAGMLHPGSLAGRVHVGDTPMDVAAALGAGAGALGVATGVFSAAELEAAGGAEASSSGTMVVVKDFTDTAATLRTIRELAAAAAAAAAGAGGTAAAGPTAAAAAATV